MAVYKIPQDVEADDKLIGPFNFRQFIYLIIVAIAIATAWVLSKIFLPLAISTLPIIIFFGALALPLRKDQPMEIYMAAILSFYLKPRKRMWEPDGIESLIEITVPKVVEYSRTKDLDQTEARRRLSYLADIVDSQGWAVRGQGIQAPNNSMNNDIYFEAQQAEDIQDTNNNIAQTLKLKLDQSDAQHHQEITDIMNHKTIIGTFDKISITSVNDLAQSSASIPIYNPYPENIRQSVIQPLSNNPIQPTTLSPINQPTNTSVNTVSTDIINLASNTDLSIAAIAREASRIQKKQDEVFISLR